MPPITPEDPFDERDPHAFLFDLGQRFAGVLVAEQCDHVQRFTWEEYDHAARRALPKADPIWSICMIWIHRKQRSKGLATLLVRKAIDCLGTDTASIGWHTPFTDLGRAFVEKLCPSSFIVAK